jgi:predicted nucleic acid-binding protein
LAYWDASALVKLYAAEANGHWFVTFARSEESVLTSTLSEVEVSATLYRKRVVDEVSGDLPGYVLEKFRRDLPLGRESMLSYDRRVRREAHAIMQRAFSSEPPILIRSADIIHVATARVHSASTVVTTDKRLAQLARVLGLEVLPHS